MTSYTRDEVAARAGLDPAFVARLIDTGIVTPDDLGRFTVADVRLVTLVQSLEGAGIPLDGLAAAMRRGDISFDFLSADAYERFSAMAPETFRQVSERTGIPLDLLMVVREAIGLAQPAPDDRMRDDEMAIIPHLELQVAEGFRPLAIERLLRVIGDSTRRIAEQEGAWWHSEVIEPALAAGKGSEGMSNPEFADRLTPLAEQAVIAMYHAHQTHFWTANIIEGMEIVLAEAGLHSRLERPPAICFLDITGYTRLTQERGDDAAADLATTLARLVERSSVRYGGRPIKWLGDGVMFYFRDPGPGIRSALEMVDGLAGAGLPPAHVGLHSGPVLFQAGDYFGQTVNLTARIADYARPGEVLVSETAATTSQEADISFVDIGEVELKGVAGTTHLMRAQLA
jgi:adenylate cyclase